MALNSRLRHCLRTPIGRTSLLSLLTVASYLLLYRDGAIAQVTADTTLTNGSTVSFDGTTYAITGGTTNSTNLFHSFEDFSLSTGQTAQFSNDVAIENIISRVTGGNRSRINGLIEANGTANLFLLNPNGIIFGANAELNIGGSFMATTADRFLFDGDNEFSATDPQDPPLLAVTTPIGLQLGSNPGPIRVNGPGSGLFIDPDFFDVVRSDRPVGVEVPLGETLALVGGPLIFNGGNITAEEGRIELGSVGQNETVLLTTVDNQWVLDYRLTGIFDDIRFMESASADVSGNGGGDVQVLGQSLSFEDGSALVSNTTGTGNGGNVLITASESINLLATSVDGAGNTLMPSGVFSEVSIGSTGNGAAVSVNTPDLNIQGGSQVSVGTFSAGNAGSLTVMADTITVAGQPSDEFLPSALVSVADIDATGSGGIVQIDTDTLSISDFGEVSAATFGAGNGGQVIVTADTINIMGNAAITTAVDVFIEDPSTGSGGDITVDVNTLRLSDGGQIQTTTFSAGDGGMLDITAQSAELESGSALATDVGEGATGNGGELVLRANSLLLTDGSQVLASTAGEGRAGNLTVDATSIVLNGFDDIGRSGLVASAVIGEGDGGDIDVTADQLTIENGATVNVGNFGTLSSTPTGTGDSGSIFLNVDVLKLNDEGTITASSLNGRGDIDITAEFLLLSDQSNITTNALGRAPGGNIVIDTRVLSGIANSDITANAVNERGGRIIITADNIFGFQVSDLTNPAQSGTNDITASSRLGSSFSGTIQLNTPDTDSTQLVTRLEDDVIDQSGLVGSVCELDQTTNTLVVLGAGGIPPSPAQYLESNSVWNDLRLAIPTSHTQHRTQEMNVVNERSPSRDRLTRYSLPREANTWQKHKEGRIALVADGSQSLQTQANNCHQASE